MVRQRTICRIGSGIALLAICVLSASSSLGQALGLRVDWRSQAAARGSVVSGYVFNDNGTTVSQVLLRVEGLDEAGKVVSTSRLRPRHRGGIQSLVLRGAVPTASSYRVGVSSFQWMKGGGGGM